MMGETHYQDPANPCKRRCTKGLGPNGEAKEGPSRPSSQQSNIEQLSLPPSSQQSTDSSLNGNDAKTPITPDALQQTYTSLPVAYPLQEQKQQQPLGEFQGSYNAWENSTTMKEVERKLEHDAENKEKMEDGNDNGGVNGNGQNGNGLHRNGAQQNGERSHSTPRHAQPSFHQWFRPSNQFAIGAVNTEDHAQTANRWSEDFYKQRQYLQNGFGGMVSNGFGPGSGNGWYNGAGKMNGNTPNWNGSYPGTPPTQFGNHRPIAPHSASAPCTPPIDGYRPMNPPIKTEQQYEPRNYGPWQPHSPFQQMQGQGTPPPGHYKPMESALNGNAQGRSPTPSGGVASTNKRIIDLTLDDDDDCVVVKQSIPPRPRPPIQRTPCPIQPGQVCYGMVKRAIVNAHRVPTPRPGMDKFPHCWPITPVCLTRVQGGCTLAIRVKDCTGNEIGCLDMATARGLAPLMDNKMIRTQARLGGRKKVQGEFPGGAFVDGPQQLNLFINVYGQERQAGYVGGHLRSKGIELHQPCQPDDVPYLNPHDPRNSALINQQMNRLIAPTPTSIQTVTKTQESLKNDIIEVLDHLERWKNLPEMEQDEKIITPLLPHQKIGLAFMTAREKDLVHDGNTGSLWKYERDELFGKDIWKNTITENEVDKPPPQCYGGILADVMGLGKTLSILSLIASTTDKAVEYAKKPPFMGANNNVVTPVKTTLLICPLSTISNWEEQIKQHIKPGSMSMYVYHGGKRQTDLEQLKSYDVIMTTYQIIAGEMAKFMKGGSSFKTLFGELSFFRIVLDEAHMIREQNTAQFKGTVSIEGQRRWAVTGTPIQNRLDDLHALIAFIRLYPFNDKRVFKDYIATPFKMQESTCLERVRTLVDSVTLRRQKDKINLPDRVDQVVRLEMGPDQREIYDATRKQSDNRMKMVTKSGTLSGKAYVHILQAILRLRLICAHGRELLGEDDTAGLTSSDAIDVDELEDKKVTSIMSAKQAYEVFGLMKQTDEDKCSVCNGNVDSQLDKQQSVAMKGVTIGFLTPCLHLLCKNGCVDVYKKTVSENLKALSGGFTDGQRGACNICNGVVKTTDVFELQEGGAAEVEAGEKAKNGKKEVKYRGPSVKVRSLISSLMENREQSTPEEPIKSVVFSCWTSHMDLIGKAFDDHGILFVRLDGSMSRPARSDVIEKFRNDPIIEVILISIAAGGLGLNLTCAQKVYVMEPQFNPAAEAQAIDRVHRLGQKKTVTTVRYIMEDSFENKILELQQKKQDIANLSLTGKLTNKTALTRQRLKDLASLFK